MAKRLDLAAWNQGIGSVIDAVDGSDLLPALMKAIGALVPFEEWYVAFFRKEAAPIVVDYSYKDKMRDRYAEGPYLLDPFYNAYTGGVEPGCYSIKALAPRDFTSSEFYTDYYAPWGEGDEAGYILPVMPDVAAHVSVSRPGSKGRFTPAEMRMFRSASPVVGAVMRRVWERMQPSIKSEGHFGAEFHVRMTQAFLRFGTSVLTHREGEIAHLLLRGHSAKSVARLLEISPGTVRNHMKSIYAKLGISSQSELFGLFFEALAHMGEDLSIDPLQTLREGGEAAAQG